MAQAFLTQPCHDDDDGRTLTSVATDPFAKHVPNDGL